MHWLWFVMHPAHACRGNLSPLSTGWTPQQAMDLDAAAPDVPLPGSASSPHTNPTPKSSGEHSHRYGAHLSPCPGCEAACYNSTLIPSTWACSTAGKQTLILVIYLYLFSGYAAGWTRGEAWDVVQTSPWSRRSRPRCTRPRANRIRCSTAPALMCPLWPCMRNAPRSCAAAAAASACAPRRTTSPRRCAAPAAGPRALSLC